MKTKIDNKATTYIFNIIAFIILIGSLTIYKKFDNTNDTVQKINLQSNIEYIDNITTNISQMIKECTSNNIYESLKKDTKLRERLEENLKLLITKRYRYIYVVDKVSDDSKEFRFLLDGAKDEEEKSEFEELYEPLDFDKWNRVYKTKKAYYFEHKDLESIWLTYLKPIVIEGKVKAIVVIDFSLKEHKIITSSLENLDSTFELSLGFTFIIFFVIIIFSYIDARRLKKLQEVNENLHKSKIEIQMLNDTLQDRIDKEVEKNRQKDQQLFQQSRLAQMGEMISMIAHQWRQPLAAISSTSSSINLKAQLELLDNKTALELSEKISDYSQHLSQTINDFREFFKPNKEKKDITYNQVIGSVLNIIELSLKNKKITLIKEYNSSVVFNTYPNEIKQVILNLIKNAEDILIDNSIKNPTIKIKTDGNLLSVSDNGGGVPQDIIDKIFDPYFSTKIKKDGTGLGLYMSKIIIEEHCEGKITVENNKDGAVFTIILKEKE